MGERKNRFDHKTGEHVIVVEDAAFRNRLDELRRMSVQINHDLQEKFFRAGLPYHSSHKSHGELTVLRITVMLRPPFYRSGDTIDHYTGSDDEIAVFFHVTPDNHIQTVRAYCGTSSSSHTKYFTKGLLPDPHTDVGIEEKKKLEISLESGNLGAFSDFVMDRLTPAPLHKREGYYPRTMTDFYQRAFSMTSTEDLKQYFDRSEYMFHQPPEIVRNLAKISIDAVLEHELKSMIDEKKERREIENALHATGLSLLSVEFTRSGVKRTIGDFIQNAPQYISQRVTNIVKHRKADIYGWVKHAESH